MKKLIFILILSITLFSCTDASQAKLGSYNDQFKIEVMNCDGSITHSWISTGKVSSEENSDGYYFLDTKTGELIVVSGNVIITRLPKTAPIVKIN
jgi:hypothetical protein